MTTPPDRASGDQQLGVIRLLHAGMLVGLIAIVAVAVIATGSLEAGFARPEAVTAILIAVGCGTVGLSYILPGLIADRVSGSSAPPETAQDGAGATGLFFVKQLIGLALHEGGTFMMAIAGFLQPQAWGIVAGGIAIALFALRSPTRDSFEGWRESRRRDASIR